ncbi:MAG: hypothetical protein Q7Q71_15705 [Verrucomicrobiota bacterium JB023]|nr:hypothetical protein [Verrucomicrobiota bacterium JB023]
MNALPPLLVLLSLALFQPVGAATGGPDASGYAWKDSLEADGPAYQWIELTDDAEPILTASGGASAIVELARPWGGIYGDATSHYLVSQHGYLSNDPTDPGSDSTNDCPLPSSPDLGGGNRIYVLHDDLQLHSEHGAVVYQFFPESPHPHHEGGVHVFTWQNVHHAGEGEELFSFQALLFENLDLLFQYAPGNPENGAGSSTGIQNATAALGLEVACDTEGSLPDNYAVLITPPVLTVTTEVDEFDSPAGEDLSLREAIRDATSGSRIEFEEGGWRIDLSSPGGGRGNKIDMGAKSLAIDASRHRRRVVITGRNALRHHFIQNGAWCSLAHLTYEEGRITGFGGTAGSIRVRGSSTLIAYRCHWLDNFCQADSGAVHVEANSQAHFHFCDFMRNQTNSAGGALSGRNGALIKAEKCRFYRNIAGRDGSGAAGAISLNNATAELRHCEFALNASPSSGGAITGNINANLTCHSCTFDNNRASRGGAFAAENNRSATGTPVQAVFDRCTFYQNVALLEGGALYESSYTDLDRTADVSLRHCSILENVAGLQGGGFSIGEADIEIAASLLGHNQAFNTEDNLTIRGSGSLDASPGDNYETGSEGNFQYFLGVSGANLNYAPLGYYGGFVRTCMLLADSDGVDSVQVDTYASPVDARGLPSFRTPLGSGLGLADVGAVELGPVVLVTSEASSGPGSFAEALGLVENGGIIQFEDLPPIDLSTQSLLAGPDIVFIDGSLQGRVVLRGLSVTSSGRQYAFHRCVFSEGERFSISKSSLLSLASQQASLSFSDCIFRNYEADVGSVLTAMNTANLSIQGSSFRDCMGGSILALRPAFNSSAASTMFLRDSDLAHNHCRESLITNEKGNLVIQRASAHRNDLGDGEGDAAIIDLGSSSKEMVNWAFIENTTLSTNQLLGSASSGHHAAILHVASTTSLRNEMEVNHGTFYQNQLAAASTYEILGASDEAAISLANTILSSNETDFTLAGDGLVSRGGNLSDRSPAAFGADDVPNMNPDLGSLAIGLNGTFHHPLQTESPCLDSGKLLDGGPWDGRRGLRFQAAYGSSRQPDIGAVESGTVLKVTTLTDEDNGALGFGTGDSLRECLAEAEAAGGINIAFDESLHGQTFTLEEPLLIETGANDINATALDIAITSLSTDATLKVMGQSLCSLEGLTFPSQAQLSRVSDDGALSFNDCEITQSSSTIFQASDSGRLSVASCQVAENEVAGQILYANRQATVLMDRSSIVRNHSTSGGQAFNAMSFTSGQSVTEFRNCILAENGFGPNTLTHNDAAYAGYLNCTINRNGGHFDMNHEAMAVLDHSILSNFSTVLIAEAEARLVSLGGNLSEISHPVLEESLGDRACRLPYLAPLADYDGDGLMEQPPLAASPVFGLPVGATSPPGQVIEVTTLDDENHLPAGDAVSLREAIRDATPGATIRFSPALDGGTIQLAQNLGVLIVEKDMSIDATSLPRGLTLDGALEGPPSGGVSLAIHGLNLTRQGFAHDGAAIIWKNGPLVVSHSSLSLYKGSALELIGGAATLSHVSFDANQSAKGVILAEGSDLELSHCALTANLVTTAVCSLSDESTLTVYASYFARNSDSSSDVPSFESLTGSTVQSLGYNAFADSPAAQVATDFIKVPELLLDAEPPLEPLTDNGGWAWTISPDVAATLLEALPEATDYTVPPPLFDARGYPRVSGQTADIGPHERAASQLDRDQDELPDYWEWFYGFDSKSTDDAGSDPDSDQFNNLEEFQAGTNPLLPEVGSGDVIIVASYLWENPATGNTVFRIEWVGTAGVDYEFLSSPDLEDWQTELGPVSATGGLDSNDLPYTPGEPGKEFFQIRELP